MTSDKPQANSPEVKAFIELIETHQATYEKATEIGEHIMQHGDKQDVKKVLAYLEPGARLIPTDNKDKRYERLENGTYHEVARIHHNPQRTAETLVEEHPNFIIQEGRFL